MRQFLYLDTDIVNSIIAQAEKGLVDAITTEEEKNQGQGNTKTVSLDGSGEVGASVWKLAKAEASLELQGNLEFTSSKSNNTKEIIAKTLHDAAFEIAYNVIKPETIILGVDNASPGDYIEMSRVFEFVDLQYLERLFVNGGVVELLKKTEKENLQREKDAYIAQMNRAVKRQNNSKLNTDVKELVKEKEKQYDDIHGMITAIGSIVPYERMLVSNDGYLIPLEDKFFRVNPFSLGFMYGGDIKCVGMITNIIGKDTDPNDDSNIFASLHFSINEILRQILPTKEEKLYVVSPIAIYYENE